MKKLNAICFLVFFTITVHAQINNKTKFNELSQDQLDLALAKSIKTIKMAQIWTAVGIGLVITGSVVLVDDMNNRRSNTAILGGLPTSETAAGILMVTGGVVTELIAIPVSIKGSKRKKDLEIELVKFNPKGSSSINGIGLKLRF
jgi:hypothetical protein